VVLRPRDECPGPHHRAEDRLGGAHRRGARRGQTAVGDEGPLRTRRRRRLAPLDALGCQDPGGARDGLSALRGPRLGGDDARSRGGRVGTGRVPRGRVHGRLRRGGHVAQVGGRHRPRGRPRYVSRRGSPRRGADAARRLRTHAPLEGRVRPRGRSGDAPPRLLPRRHHALRVGLRVSRCGHRACARDRPRAPDGNDRRDALHRHPARRRDDSLGHHDARDQPAERHPRREPRRRRQRVRGALPQGLDRGDDREGRPAVRIPYRHDLAAPEPCHLRLGIPADKAIRRIDRHHRVLAALHRRGDALGDAGPHHLRRRPRQARPRGNELRDHHFPGLPPLRRPRGDRPAGGLGLRPERRAERRRGCGVPPWQARVPARPGAALPAGHGRRRGRGAGVGGPRRGGPAPPRGRLGPRQPRTL